MQLIAHRGSPADRRAENTVPAVLAAFAAGADGVEVDLRLTADGVLAACHDSDLTRVAGSPVSVAASTWAALRAGAGEVPLARVEWVLAAASGRPVVLELKPAPARAADVLAERLAGLARAGLPLDLTVSSFDRRLLDAVRRTAPARLGLRTALLGGPGLPPLPLLRRALQGGHDAIHPHVDALLAGPEAVVAARGCGVTVTPWTVNDPVQARHCLELGVAAVITDAPQAVRRLLAGAESGQRAVVM